VLEWRKATPLEAEAYSVGHSEGWSDGADWGEKHQMERIIKLLEELMNNYGEPYWHLDRIIALIKGEK
jgi:hypothetical protein